MMKNSWRKGGGRWTFLVASRYFSSKRKDKNFASSVLSVVGIAVGTMTLITVLAVMNGFQIGFIEDILEISSFHVRMDVREGENPENLVSGLRSLKGIESALPILETQTMVVTDFSGFQPCLLRGVPSDFPGYDPGMAEQLGIIEMKQEGLRDGEILLGVELADHLGVNIGENLRIISLAGDEFAGIKPEQIEYRVAGLFRSGYYEFDRGMGFITLESAEEIASNTDVTIIGIKLTNRYNDKSAISMIRSLDFPGSRERKIVSWREYNSSFFGALRMEKIAMMVLVGLIFIVVGGNIYQSLKRTVFEKIEEISLLKSIGASGKSIRRIFIFDGIFIGFLGGITGLLLGFVIAFNINVLFSIFERISNFILFIVRQIVNPILGAGMEEVSIFSPRYYYMSEVPVTLPYSEAVLIFLFAFLSSAAAAFFASKRITTIQPSEVLHYE